MRPNACLLAVLVVAAIAFGGDGNRVANVRTIGAIHYRGPHTWAGVIDVKSDDAAFQDGNITADVSGVPQGITFSGDRKNITLKNLTLDGVGDGINIGNNQRVDGLVIDKCKFLNCRSPDATSHDVLLGQRGIGIFGSAGRNWTIRNTVFKTKTRDPAQPDQRDGSAQYACRLGTIIGLNVSDSRFENWCGKACTWLMFVRGAAFENVEFSGGAIRIGVRPNDMPDIPKGDCRNIIFRNCTFTFGQFDDWPAGILVYPGSESVRFENCTITTVEGSEWWLEVDERNTREIHWKNCTWNGKTVEGYVGIRSSMSIEEMKSKAVGPME